MESTSIVKVSRSNTTFDTWLDQPFIANDLRSQLEKANVLLIPVLGYCEYEGPLFSEGTDEFFQFLTAKQSDKMHVDICIANDEYRELTLRQNEFILATMIVWPVVAPIISHYIVQFLDYKLGARVADTRIKSRVVIPIPEAGRSVEVEYEGTASEYSNYVTSTLGLVRSVQDLQRLGETDDMDHAERIKHLSSNRVNSHD